MRKRNPLSEETKKKIGLANSKKKYKKKCKICKKIFFVTPSRKTKAKFCSYPCMGLWNKGKEPWNKGKKGLQIAWNKGRECSEWRGEKHHNWKGGRYLGGGRTKYFFVYSPHHPLKNKDEYVLEHRLVMEKYLGRFLTRREVVHHQDKNTKNNKIENLRLFSSDSEHHKYHAKFYKAKK